MNTCLMHLIVHYICMLAMHIYVLNSYMIVYKFSLELRLG
jgi:hypothetical protein